MSSRSGSARWMTSATALAWALSGVDRSLTSAPAALRLSEALKVATRSVRSGAADDAVPDAGAPAGAALAVPETAVVARAAAVRAAAASARRGVGVVLDMLSKVCRPARPWGERCTAIG